MMRKKLTIAALGAGLLASTLGAQAANAEDPEVVYEWNQILQNTLPPVTAAFQGPRLYAMMHIAIFDSVNAIERDYSPYRVMVKASSGASQEAAAAQAAHDVLWASIPTAEARAIFDAALAARLATIDPDRARQGVAIGRATAAEILAWRQNDGSTDPPPTYVLPLIPGLWQRTPPGFLPAGATQFPGVDPFALLTSTQFLPRRFPELNSAEYAADFNEVKASGLVNSLVRTPDQTQLALLFAGVITPTSNLALWQNVARDVARARMLSLVDAARVFALLNATFNDSLQTSHTSKFVYGLWRPVTAIEEADEDLNPLTDPQPGWLPLLITPPYPSHSSNMACNGAGAARALANVFGTNDIAITARWYDNTGNTGTPVATRNYAGFWAMALDQGRSRVYGGIHFTFELTASQESCAKVADYAFENYMTPAG
jgi:PAP2 superfamily